jgi:rubrerythrin
MMYEIESALEVIRRAVHNEIAGQRFYNDAALYCVDPWAKDVFVNLAQEEERHTKFLLVEYESLETRGRWVDPEVALQAEGSLDITNITLPDDDPVEELFPPQWTMAETVDRRANDLGALTIGLKMEQRAIALYRREATENPDPAAREAYRFLVEDEMRHHDQLKEEWERLAGIPFPGG